MTTQKRSAKNSLGFTLIELMVVVAIIGILAGIGYPSYVQYVIKANRSAAQTYMFQLANKEEQYLLDARQYTSDAASLLPIPSDVSKNYTITITLGTPPPHTYQIKAAATDNQASRDTKCKDLTLTQDGTKGITGTGTVTNCW